MSRRAWPQRQPAWSPAQSASWTPRHIPDTDPELPSCDMRSFADDTCIDLQGVYYGLGAPAAAATRLLKHLNMNDDISEWLYDKGWRTFESQPLQARGAVAGRQPAHAGRAGPQLEQARRARMERGRDHG